MEITGDRLEKALSFIATTDHEYGQWKAMVLRSEYMAGVKEALTYKALEGTVEDRKRGAKCADEVKAAWEEHFQCVAKFEVLKARRAREVMIVDLYRTMEATRRAGNIQ